MSKIDIDACNYRKSTLKRGKHDVGKQTHTKKCFNEFAKHITLSGKRTMIYSGFSKFI